MMVSFLFIVVTGNPLVTGT